MPAPTTPGQLAPARLEALRLSANGLTSAEIARRVGATKTAVDVRLTAASRCLGTRSRIQAVAVAMRLGLLRAEDVTVPEALCGDLRPASDPEAPKPHGAAEKRSQPNLSPPSSPQEPHTPRQAPP